MEVLTIRQVSGTGNSKWRTSHFTSFDTINRYERRIKLRHKSILFFMGFIILIFILSSLPSLAKVTYYNSEGKKISKSEYLQNLEKRKKAFEKNNESEESKDVLKQHQETRKIKKKEEAGKELEEKRKQKKKVLWKNLETRCASLGYDYGLCAARAIVGLPCDPANDIVIPLECRGKISTKRGIEAGTNFLLKNGTERETVPKKDQEIHNQQSIVILSSSTINTLLNLFKQLSLYEGERAEHAADAIARIAEVKKGEIALFIDNLYVISFNHANLNVRAALFNALGYIGTDKSISRIIVALIEHIPLSDLRKKCRYDAWAPESLCYWAVAGISRSGGKKSFVYLYSLIRNKALPDYVRATAMGRIIYTNIKGYKVTFSDEIIKLANSYLQSSDPEIAEYASRFLGEYH